MNEEDWDIIDSSVREWAAPQEQEQQARDAVIIRGVLGFSPERRSNGLAAQDAQFTQALSPGILGSRALGQLPYFAPAVNSDAVGITSKISRFPTDAKIPDKYSPIRQFKIGRRNTVPATGANHSRRLAIQGSCPSRVRVNPHLTHFSSQ